MNTIGSSPLHFSTDGTSSTDELSFQLSSETTPATSIMIITNPNNKAIAYGVMTMTSNKARYSFDPTYGVIGAGDHTTLAISLDSAEQHAILVDAGNGLLPRDDQIVVLSTFVVGNLAQLIESQEPRDRKAFVYELLSGQQYPRHGKRLWLQLVVAQTPPLPAAKIRRLAPMSTIADDPSSSEDEGDNNGSGVDWPEVWAHNSESSLREYKVPYLRLLCLKLGESTEGDRNLLCKTLWAHMRSRPMPGAPPPPVIPRKKRVAQRTAEVVAKMSKVTVKNSTLPRALNAGGDRTGPEERLEIVFDFAQRARRRVHA